MKEQITADTPMTVGMFNEYMAQRAEAVHRAMKAIQEQRDRIPLAEIVQHSFGDTPAL
jgi:hypothetical protein